MVEFTITGEALWDRMERAVERVNDRLRKTIRILEEAKIPYAIVGGHAVRAWVAQVDAGAVRTTKDVDVLLRRENLPDMIQAMTQNGFYHRETVGVDIFTEKPDESAREAVHVVIANEMVKPGEFDPNPDLEPQTRANDFNTVRFETLVRMKLNSFRDKDRVHLRDMIEVGLIDRSWLERFPVPLCERLRIILDDPFG
jgi:hypothetical protein